MQRRTYVLLALMTLSNCHKQPDPIELKKAEFIAVCDKRLSARTNMPSLVKMISHEDHFMVGKGNKDFTFDSTIEYDLPNNQGLPIRFKAECHYNYPALSDTATPDKIFIDNMTGADERYLVALKQLKCEPFDWDFQSKISC